MKELNLGNEVLENAIGVHRSLEKIEPLNPMDAVAVQAMEELLEYRAIGTVEEIWSMIRKSEFPQKPSKEELISELKEFSKMKMMLECYEDIGTIEEFKALKEKNETLKALYEDARKEGNNLIIKIREEVITEFAEKLRPRLNTLVDRLRLDEIACKMKGE